jgi:hypothetical protein
MQDQMICEELKDLPRLSIAGAITVGSLPDGDNPCIMTDRVTIRFECSRFLGICCHCPVDNIGRN